MYDDFVGNCPKCGGDFSSQSKLGECEMKDLRVGSEIQIGFSNTRLRLKSPCPKCGIFPVAVIQNNILRAFEDGPADQQEGLFGALYGDGERPADEWKEAMLNRFADD